MVVHGAVAGIWQELEPDVELVGQVGIGPGHKREAGRQHRAGSDQPTVRRQPSHDRAPIIPAHETEHKQHLPYEQRERVFELGRQETETEDGPHRIQGDGTGQDP